MQIAAVCLFILTSPPPKYGLNSFCAFKPKRFAAKTFSNRNYPTGSAGGLKPNRSIAQDQKHLDGSFASNFHYAPEKTVD
jgi:hypothetical protein